MVKVLFSNRDVRGATPTCGREEVQFWPGPPVFFCMGSKRYKSFALRYSVSRIRSDSNWVSCPALNRVWYDKWTKVSPLGLVKSSELRSFCLEITLPFFICLMFTRTASVQIWSNLAENSEILPWVGIVKQIRMESTTLSNNAPFKRHFARPPRCVWPSTRSVDLMIHTKPKKSPAPEKMQKMELIQNQTNASRAKFNSMTEKETCMNELLREGENICNLYVEEICQNSATPLQKPTRRSQAEMFGAGLPTKTLLYNFDGPVYIVVDKHSSSEKNGYLRTSLRTQSE